VSTRRSNERRRVGPAGGAVHTAVWFGRLSAEALELGTLAVTAVIAHLGRKALRRVNRKGLLGWGIVVLAALLVATVILEIIEMM
jgi:hypothetical protein